MRDIERIQPMMHELATIWKKHFPDMRFCQWMIAEMHDYPAQDCYYVEDDKFMEFIRNKYYMVKKETD